MNRFISSRYFIFIILVIGLVLRLFSLNQSLWLDEATSAIVAKMPFVDIFTKFLPGDFHPPLYYLLLKCWVLVFGSSEVVLRIPSVIFGTILIYVVYKISENYYAPILVATSGLLIYYSQEARMYILAALLVTLSVYFFKNKKWFWFSILVFLIGMNDYISLFILPVFIFLTYKTRKTDLKKVLISFPPLLFIFLLWSPIFISQLGAGLSMKGSNWWNILGVTSLTNILLIPIKFMIGRISFDNNIIYTVVVLLVSFVYGYLAHKARKSSELIWVWLIFPIVVGIIVSFKIPTLTYFRFIFCLPALFILIAEGIQKSGKYRYVFFALVLFANLTSSAYYLLNTKFQREDWRNAALTVGLNKIILPVDSQKEALNYYGKSGQAIYYKNFEGGEPEIWLSRYVWEIFDKNDEARRKVENLGYNKVLTANFNGVVFVKYAYSNRH